ncbi:MAG: transcription termination factor Rho [Actinomycetota bacterium]|jgi:transcription termination factor Rho
MENENNEVVVDNAESTESAPRKRAPRRAVKKSPDAPIEVTEGQAASDNAESSNDAPAEGDAPADGGRSRSRSRGRGRGGNKSENAEGDSNENSDAPAGDDEGQSEGGRGRQRNRKRGRGRDDDFDAVSDDDVLIPVAGILDILDNYAFVRTAGYLASPADIYVALGQVKKYNLRRGDAIVGAIRQPRDNDFQNRQKYNALATIDFVNGAAPEEAVTRDDFADLTPIHATEGLGLHGRFDWVKKGERVLVDAPAGATRTAVIRDLAAEISASATDAHLMVVVSDGLPEDVTALGRGVRGEVAASSYDRHADEHVTVAELAVARAKRLVEKGHHVVVLIDSLTRVAKSQLAVIQGSRPIGDGPVDSAVFAATKRLFGAGRSLEAGGSLTVIATVDNQTDGFPGAVREELLDIATGTVTL